MRSIRFGLSLPPGVADVERVRELTLLADAAGLDLLGIQDHPYVSQFLDTMSLIAVLLAETKKLRLFPNVASLPLRSPTLLAKSAASLDVLSEGRFELGIGAGASYSNPLCAYVTLNTHRKLVYLHATISMRWWRVGDGSCTLVVGHLTRQWLKPGMESLRWGASVEQPVRPLKPWRRQLQ